MLTWLGSYLFCYAVMILLIGASIWRTRVPTIDAMQAQMLRDIPALHAHRQFARRQEKAIRAYIASSSAMIEALYGRNA